MISILGLLMPFHRRTITTLLRQKVDVFSLSVNKSLRMCLENLFVIQRVQSVLIVYLLIQKKSVFSSNYITRKKRTQSDYIQNTRVKMAQQVVCKNDLPLFRHSKTCTIFQSKYTIKKRMFQ